MRWRTINVLTNTPPKTSQRAPGGMQGNGLMEPVITKAANKLGIDQVEIRKINAPAGKAPFGPPAGGGRRGYVTSAFVREALDKGAEIFNWEEKKARSGKRVGTKVRGSGVAISAYTAGSTGFDGLLVIRPDGKVQIQSGIGNLGTHSVIDVHRVAADVLGVPWDQCEVVWGNTAKHLPWSCISAGSQTCPRDDARGPRRGHRSEKEDPGSRGEGARACPPSSTCTYALATAARRSRRCRSRTARGTSSMPKTRAAACGPAARRGRPRRG